MKKTRFSDNQIVYILKQAEQGVPITELCREHNISQSTFYNWRSKYGGMDASLIARLKELEVENARLKKMYADECLKSDILQDAMSKKWSRPSGAKRWLVTILKSMASVSAGLAVSLTSASPVIITSQW